MSHLVKFVLSGVVLVVLALAALLFIFMDANDYKPRLEKTMSAALGMEVRIAGEAKLDFSSGLHLALHDLHISNRGSEIARIRTATLGVNLLPLLQQDIQLNEIYLDAPTITIERNLDGGYNFQRPAQPEKKGYVIPEIVLSDATLRYHSRQTDAAFEASNCNVNISNFGRADAPQLRFLQRLSFNAQTACSDLKSNDYTLTDLKFLVAAEGGIYKFNPFTLSLFNGRGSGEISADFTGDEPSYKVDYALAQFRLEELLKTLSPNKLIAKGTADVSVRLTLQGKKVPDLQRSAKGEFTMRGENLTLYNGDLDQQIEKFEASQTFTLVDIGAFLYAGPLGMAVTHGYDMANLLHGSSGSSNIRKLVNKWDVAHGTATARDVAMATAKNRIALQGTLDLVNQRFDQTVVAVLDNKGCARAEERVSGSFHHPTVAKPNILIPIAGPVVKLFNKMKGGLSGKECTVFYSGSVAAPE
ncbi:MAG: AsmA family protein [Pseudomonadota bacterium]